MSKTKKITFYATVPPIKSAVIVSGEDKPMMQIKLEIPASEIDKFPDLLHLGGRLLVVEITVSDAEVFGAGDGE